MEQEFYDEHQAYHNQLRMELFQDKELNEIYDSLIQAVSGKLGMDYNSGSDYIDEIMNVVAWHESDRTMESNLIHPNSPARGLFGYEVASSDIYPDASGAGRTAMNRLYAILGGRLAAKGVESTELDDMPAFMMDFFDGPHESDRDVDFSLLTAQEQKILFLADHLQAGSFDSFGKTLLKSGELPRWWANYHHKGSDSDTKIFDDNWKLWEIEKNK